MLPSITFKKVGDSIMTWSWLFLTYGQSCFMNKFSHFLKDWYHLFLLWHHSRVRTLTWAWQFFGLGLGPDNFWQMFKWSIFASNLIVNIINFIITKLNIYFSQSWTIFWHHLNTISPSTTFSRNPYSVQVFFGANIYLALAFCSFIMLWNNFDMRVHWVHLVRWLSF